MIDDRSFRTLIRISIGILGQECRLKVSIICTATSEIVAVTIDQGYHSRILALSDPGISNIRPSI
jgi:hypothetical protein